MLRLLTARVELCQSVLLLRFLLTGRALPRQALVQDIVLCKDLQVLESVQQVLAFLTGQGKLRHKVGRSFDETIALPSAHQDACHTATVRAQRRQEAIRAWKRAQMMKARHGLVCVRYVTNEAFDVVDHHDDKGFTLDFEHVRPPR